VVGTIAGVILALVLEIAAFAAYAIFFRDRMIANLEKKMLAPSPPGTPMPYDWKIETLEDESVDMAAFEGKPLFLVFFSPSCPKCEAQLPGVQRLYDEVKGDGLAFVVVSTRDNEQLVPMLERRNCTFPVYTFGGKRPPLFKRVQVPSAYVFSPDGQLLYEQFDAARWDDPKFAAYLKSLMGSETAGEVKPS
jgi:peroxiredoxin